MRAAAVTLMRRGRSVCRAAALVIVLFGALCATVSVAHAQNPPEAVEYYATDALGSVRVVYNSTGQVLGRSAYLPFGETLNQSGALPRQRFTGQERDGEAGLDYFNARDLQTRTGRMNAPDPLFGDAMTSPQRWNRYTYVGNNPLRFTDPSGMFASDRDGQFFAADQSMLESLWEGGGGGGSWDASGDYMWTDFDAMIEAERAYWAAVEEQQHNKPTPEVTSTISVTLPDGTSIKPADAIVVPGSPTRIGPDTTPASRPSGSTSERTWFGSVGVSVVGFTGFKFSVGAYCDRAQCGGFWSLGPAFGVDISASVSYGSVNGNHYGFGGVFDEYSSGISKWGATYLDSGTGVVGTAGNAGFGVTPVSGSVAKTYTGLFAPVKRR